MDDNDDSDDEVFQQPLENPFVDNPVHHNALQEPVPAPPPPIPAPNRAAGSARLHGIPPVVPPVESWVLRNAARAQARANAHAQPVPNPSNQGEINHIGFDFWTMTDIYKAEANWVTRVTSEQVPIPKTYEEALDSVDKTFWWDAMKEEVDALIDLNTWTLVPRDTVFAKTIITGKWVFAIKPLPEGKVRYKARWVARGFTQKEGIDYNETFAPVMNSKSWHFLMALAAEWNYTVSTMDVANAFLHGYLKEEIFMEMPQGFEKEDFVCKLLKSLYGLKQAANVWFEELVKILTEKMGYKQLISDSVMFKKNSTILGGHVDDLLIIAPTPTDQEEFKSTLLKHLKAKQGALDLYLGVEARRDDRTGTITIHHYRKIYELLQEHRMLDSKPVSVPMDQSNTLSRADCPAPGSELPQLTRKMYRSAVGSLMHIMTITRPDIALPVKKLAGALDNPGEKHVLALKWLLRYLNGTRGYGITYYGKNDPIRNNANIDFTLHGYYDSDWGADTHDRKSIHGYVFLMAGGAISWFSGKEQIVARSSTQAEYIAQDAAAREIEFFVHLQKELGIHKDYIPTIYGDNQGAIKLGHNPVNHQRSKHIDIKYHAVREQIKLGTFKIQYIPSKENTADMLTKALDRVPFEKLRGYMGLSMIRED